MSLATHVRRVKGKEGRAKESINKETPINLVRAHFVTHITNLHITRETLINHDLL